MRLWHPATVQMSTLGSGLMYEARGYFGAKVNTGIGVDFLGKGELRDMVPLNLNPC